MKYFIALCLMFSIGCGPTIKTKMERIEKGKILCCSQGGLWYLDGDMAHCNNGSNFFNLDRLVIHDKSCPASN